MFIAGADGRSHVYLQGEHHAFSLLGHGAPPRLAQGIMTGQKCQWLGDVEFRPLRDKPFAMIWDAVGQPGDIVITANDAYLMVLYNHPRRSEFSSGPNTWIDVATGRSPSGPVSGPLFRGWDLVCFPQPNRPMVVGSYDGYGRA